MRPRRRRPALLAAALVVVAVAGPVGAAFGDVATATSGTFAAAVLDPPTGLTGKASCEAGLLGLLARKPVVDLAWTRGAALVSSTSSLRGQDVRVVIAGTLRPAVTKAAVDSGSTSAAVIGYVDGAGSEQPLPTSTAVPLQVRSLWGSWTSVAAETTVQTGSCVL